MESDRTVYRKGNAVVEIERIFTGEKEAGELLLEAFKGEQSSPLKGRGREENEGK